MQLNKEEVHQQIYEIAIPKMAERLIRAYENGTFYSDEVQQCLEVHGVLTERFISTVFASVTRPAFHFVHIKSLYASKTRCWDHLRDDWNESMVKEAKEIVGNPSVELILITDEKLRTPPLTITVTLETDNAWECYEVFASGRGNFIPVCNFNSVLCKSFASDLAEHIAFLRL